jgi:uncharacterized protein
MSSNNSKLTSGDLLLLLIYSKGTTEGVNEPIVGRTRLVKMVFLFEKEVYKDFCKDRCLIEEQDLPDFFAWHFGPMSKEVLQDLEFFIKIHFIEAKEEKNTFAFEEAEEFSSLTKDSSFDEDPEEVYIYQKYFLTDLGKKYVEENLLPVLSQNQKEMLSKLKLRLNTASLTKILKYVYTKYPLSALKSKIAGKVID